MVLRVRSVRFHADVVPLPGALYSWKSYDIGALPPTMTLCDRDQSTLAERCQTCRTPSAFVSRSLSGNTRSK